MPRRSSFSAVLVNVIAKLAIHLCRLLHSLVKHLTPLSAILIELDHAQEIARLNNDLECVAEIVRVGADLLSLFHRDRRRVECFGHRRFRFSQLGALITALTTQMSEFYRDELWNRIAIEFLPVAPSPPLPQHRFDTTRRLCNTRTCCQSSRRAGHSRA